MDEEQSFARLVSSTTLPARPAWDTPAAGDDHDPWANPFVTDITSNPFASSSYSADPRIVSSSPRETSPYVKKLQREHMVPEMPSVIAAREREKEMAENEAAQRGVYASSAFASPYDLPTTMANDPFAKPFAPIHASRDPVLVPFDSPTSHFEAESSVPAPKEEGKTLLKNLIGKDLMAENDPEMGLRKAFKKSEPPKEKSQVKSKEVKERKVHGLSPTKEQEQRESIQREAKVDVVKTSKEVDGQTTPTELQSQSTPTPSSPVNKNKSPTSVPLPPSPASTPLVSRTHSPLPKPILVSAQENLSRLTTPSTDRVSVSPLDVLDSEPEPKFKNLSLGGSVPYSAPPPLPNKDTPWEDSTSAAAPLITSSGGRLGGKGWGVLDEDDDDEPIGSLINKTRNGTAGLSGGELFGNNNAWGEKDDEGWGESGIDPIPAAPESASTERSFIKDTKEKEQPQSSTATSPPEKKRLPYFQITVSDPTKVGDPVRGYTVYTITTRTSSPHYQKSLFSCLRRYSDFLWLYEQLVVNNPGIIVPQVPGKHPFGRFGEEFVETRRKALERCLRKITSNPVLQLDPDLRLFLESDNFAYDSKERKAQTAAATPASEKTSGLLSGWTGSRYVEEDDWFEKRRSFLEALEAQLKTLSKAIEISSKHRIDLALALGEYAESLTALAESDLGASLSHSLSSFSNLFSTQKIHSESHAKSEVGDLLNAVDEYIKLIGSVRGTWERRVEAWRSWKEKEKEAMKLKKERERMRQAGKLGDKVQSSLGEIAMADRKAGESLLHFNNLTNLVKSEFVRFEIERILDFKNTLEKYMDGQIKREKEMIEGWEVVYKLLITVVERNQGAGQGQNR
nr:hypothetical protein L203_04976 [Cryptococcus depauperatus CBS 7841]